MIEYKLLEKDGVILTRQAEIANNEVVVRFFGGSDDATAIFVSEEGKSFYRKLSNGTCEIPSEKLNGSIKVTVAVLNGNTPLRKWHCEGLKTIKLRDGGTLILPDDMNMPQKFVELRLECQNLQQSNERLEARVKELEERLEKLLEGYDLT